MVVYGLEKGGNGGWVCKNYSTAAVGDEFWKSALINDWVVDANIFDETVANTTNSSRGGKKKQLKTASCHEHSCKNSKQHLAEYYI